MSLSLILIGGFFFAFGCCLGSFLGMLSYRIPRGLSWSDLKGPSSRSTCPKCGGSLTLFQLIPVLSYVVLRGRCGFCKGKISPRYIVIELLCGLNFMIIALFLCT